MLQPLDCLDRLHVRGLRVVECDSTLTIAAIASDASRHKRVESAAKLIVQILQVPQRIEDAIVAIGLTHGLASVLIAFHPILGLIRAFSFPVELPDADEVERVGEELSLYLHIELTVAGQARRQVYLDQPGFEVTVNHNVKAIDLETIGAMDASLFTRSENRMLSRQEALDDDIEDARPEQIHVDINLLQMLAECGQAPLEAIVIVIEVLILNIILAFLVN